MAPKKSGFNLLAWFAPGTAVVIGAFALVVLMRRWGKASQAPRVAAARPSAIPGVDATPDELARLEAAVKGDRAE
jgi:cytochrome c-type biogenesis protein CcmH